MQVYDFLGQKTTPLPLVWQMAARQDANLFSDPAILPADSGIVRIPKYVPTLPDVDQTMPQLVWNRFRLVVEGQGHVSAQAQLIASQDGQTWLPYGRPLHAPLAQNRSEIVYDGTGQFCYFSAYITRLYGKSARASVFLGPYAFDLNASVAFEEDAIDAEEFWF